MREDTLKSTPGNTPTEREVNKWMERIRVGKRYRKRYSSQKKWPEYRKMYRGDWKADIVPVNAMFSHGRSLIPRTYFRNPMVTVTETHPDLRYHARVLESVDNYLIKELALKATLKGATLTTFLCGTGPIKLGYDSQFGYLPDQAIDANMGTVTQVARRERRKIEYNANIKPGMPWALPELPENVIVPYGYKNASEMPWIAHRIFRPLRDVKQDQKYKGTRGLKGTRLSEIDDLRKVHERTFFGEDDIEYAELYEIRDFASGEMRVLCEDKMILASPDALQTEEGLNWEFLIFNDDPEHFWGLPDAGIIEPQQLELNETKTQQAQHRRIALIKFLYMKGVISEENLQHMLSGNVGPAIEVDTDVGLANAITMLQPHVPPDLQIAINELMGEIRYGLGESENQTGAYKGGTPPSATESVEVAQTTGSRDEERRDILGDLLVRIVKKWNQYIFKFWDHEQIIDIVGEDGYKQWVSFHGSELDADYHYNIDPDSGFPVSKQMRHDVASGIFKAYNGDALIDQVSLRHMHLQQYEWLFPGISRLVRAEDPELARIMAETRQPHPMGGGSGGGAGNQKGSNQGGGRRAMTKDSATPLERLQAGVQGGGGGNA